MTPAGNGSRFVEPRERLSSLRGVHAIGEMVRPKRRAELVATVVAAFDESGKLADTQYVVFAGSVATYEEWDVVSGKWKNLLANAQVDYLSMKEAMHSHGQFEGWKEKEKDRDDLLIALAEMFHSLIKYHVATPIESSQFRKLPPAVKKLLKNPQYCGFESCMRQVAGSLPDDYVVSLMCDCSEEYAVECLKMYLRLRAGDQQFKSRCVSISFCEDENSPALQAADMLAYSLRADYSRETSDPPKVVNELLRIFRSDGEIRRRVTYEFK